jgi:hypothetical protein
MKFDIMTTLILKSIAAMKSSKNYLKQAEKIDDEFNSDLPNDEDEWWRK